MVVLDHKTMVLAKNRPDPWIHEFVDLVTPGPRIIVHGSMDTPVYTDTQSIKGCPQTMDLVRIMSLDHLVHDFACLVHPWTDLVMDRHGLSTLSSVIHGHVLGSLWPDLAQPVKSMVPGAMIMDPARRHGPV